MKETIDLLKSEIEMLEINISNARAFISRNPLNRQVAECETNIIEDLKCLESHKRAILILELN